MFQGCQLCRLAPQPIIPWQSCSWLHTDVCELSSGETLGVRKVILTSIYRGSMSKTQITYPFKQNSLVGNLGLQSEGLHKCKPWIRSMLMWPISTTSNVFPNPSWIFMDAVGCFVLLLLSRFKISWVYLCCISAAPAEWSKFVSVDSATCCVVQRLQLCLGMFIWQGNTVYKDVQGTIEDLWPLWDLWDLWDLWICPNSYEKIEKGFQDDSCKAKRM